MAVTAVGVGEKCTAVLPFQRLNTWPLENYSDVAAGQNQFLYKFCEILTTINLEKCFISGMD